MKVLINIISQYEVVIGIRIGKEEIPLSVFTENEVITYMENLKNKSCERTTKIIEFNEHRKI